MSQNELNSTVNSERNLNFDYEGIETSSNLNNLNTKEFMKYNEDLSTNNSSLQESTRDNTIGYQITIEKEDSINKESFYLFSSQNSYKGYYYKRMGNLYCFFFDKEEKPLLVIGPHCKCLLL